MGVAAKLGILGGTFDPVHVGHLAIAEDARTSLALDEVSFVPAGRPWFKEASPVTDPQHRVAMVELAIRTNPGFSVSIVDVERPGPTYMVDTLTELAAERGVDTELYLLLGVDALAEIHRWREPAAVFAKATVVSVGRPGSDEFDPGSLEAISPGASESLVTLAGPGIDVSGIEIRRRVANGQSIRYLVPDAAEDYIRRHRLYRL